MSQNIYANRVYAHNPVAIWALDETVGTSYTTDLSTVADLSGLYGTVAGPYKTFSDTDNNLDAYYVSTETDETGALTGNFGVPMVHGAGNITNILDGSGSPGLIVPGLGFLHNKGKYRNFTFEFWIKIICSSVTEKRIVGPISSNDGLYVSGPFLSLRIGNNVKSYQIGEFERPMLISITYTPNNVDLTVNGSKILSVPITVDEMSFPTEADQDWIGFYAHSTIPILQIDCIATYPFLMSESMNKLHFVYGQAIETPELAIPGYKDVPVVIDYGTAKSANNYNYPQNGKWEQGIQNNMDLNGPVLKTPQYEAPTFMTDASTTYELWKTYNKTENEAVSGSSFIRMKPIVSGTTRITDNTCLSLSSLSLVGNNVNGFYLVVKTDELTDALGDVLFAAYSSDNKSFSIRSSTGTGGNYNVKIYFKEEVIKTTAIAGNTDFSIAVNIANLLAEEENEELSAFFSNLNDLKVYVGGDKTSKTYGGKIYAFGLLSDVDTASSTVSTLFTDNAGSYIGTSTSLLAYPSVYAFKPSEAFNMYDVAVSTSSYWSDVIPLSVLCKEKSDGSYDLSLIQINIDYPEYSSTSSSMLRSYLRLIENTESADIIAPATTTDAVPMYSYIQPNEADLATHRYEFVDSSRLKLPDSINAEDYLLKIELEIVNDDVIRKEFGLRYLKINSWLFDGETAIGTKHGRDVYILGESTDIKIYKDSTPYFYLSKNSGIRSGTLGPTRIPINQFQDDLYFLGGVQFAINFANVPEDGSMWENIMTIFDANGNYYTVGYELATKKIIVFESSETDYTVDLVGTKFSVYVDGTSDRILDSNSEKVWHIVGIAFEETMSFGANGGNIDIQSKYIINNIVEIQVPPLSIAQSIDYLSWSTADGPDNDLLWSQYDADGDNVLDSGDKTWGQITVSADSTIDLAKLNVDVAGYYKNFIGYNRTLVEDSTNALEFVPNSWIFRKDYRSSRIYRNPL